MKSYQTIILIGSILGIFLTIGGAFVTVSNSNPTTIEQQERANSIYVHAGVGLLTYIVILVIAFAVNNSKVVGIMSIISGFIVFLATGGFGILGFASLFAGGVVALAHKKNSGEKKELPN
jgi:hypothetical protein